MSTVYIKRGWNFDKDTLADHLGWEELPPEEELYDHLLDIDIKEFGSPVLVDIPPASNNIPKDVVLQVRRVKNVSVPETSWKSGTFESSKNDVLRYYFTDGHSSISACDMNGQFRLNKGTKVLFCKDCPIDCGFIIMDKKYLTVYGGGIPDALEQKAAKADGEDSAIARQAPKFAELLNPKKAAKVKMDYKLPSNSSENGNMTFDNGTHQVRTSASNENSIRGGRSDRGTRSGGNFENRQAKVSGSTPYQEEPPRSEYNSSNRREKQGNTNDRSGRKHNFSKGNNYPNYADPAVQGRESYSNFGQDRQCQTSYQSRRNERDQFHNFGENYETRLSTVSTGNNSKRRGSFQYGAQTASEHKKYDDYEHNVVTNLTFSKTSGHSGAPQQRDHVNRDFGRRDTQSSHSDRNRNQRRNTDNQDNNFNRDDMQGGQSSRGRGGRGSDRDRGIRDSDRGHGGGRRGGRGEYKQGNSGNRCAQNNDTTPSEPQFNAASDFDFPTLGDAMTGINLH